MKEAMQCIASFVTTVQKFLPTPMMSVVPITATTSVEIIQIICDLFVEYRQLILQGETLSFGQSMACHTHARFQTSNLIESTLQARRFLRREATTGYAAIDAVLQLRLGLVDSAAI